MKGIIAERIYAITIYILVWEIDLLIIGFQVGITFK